LQELRKSSMRVWGLLNPSRPLSFNNAKLEIEVQSAYHSEEMSTAANTALVADALHAALGVRPVVVFVARGAAAPPPAKDDLPDIDDAVADATPVESDPIELIRKGLGGEVVEEKTRS
jgi:hypothetical protein